MSNIACHIAYAEFSAGQAAEISGVNTTLQRQWRKRDLLPELEAGKHARFLPGEVLHMMIMKSFSDSSISIKAARAFTLKTKDIAIRILQALPGAVEMSAEPRLGTDFIEKERRTLEDWRDMRRCRYLFMPLPEREDTSDNTAIFEREDLSDLHTLLDEESFNGLLIDVEAIARTFLARAKRASKCPLEIRTFTIKEDIL